MFARKKNHPWTPNPVAPEVITDPGPPDPQEIPPTKQWRVEQTDGFRTIEAHRYVKGERYVTFYRYTESVWINRGHERVNGVLRYVHYFKREVACELNHDYILSIEESI